MINTTVRKGAAEKLKRQTRWEKSRVLNSVFLANLSRLVVVVRGAVAGRAPGPARRLLEHAGKRTQGAEFAETIAISSNSHVVTRLFPFLHFLSSPKL